MKILLATQNKDKIIEMKKVLSNFDIITLKDLNDFDEVEENGKTFEENAEIKARYFNNKYNLPVISDDTGLCVVSLNNEPGIYSARYSKEQTYSSNRKKLLENLNGIENREAFFSCVICYIDEKKKSHFFEGKLDGFITNTEIGSNGFGYDSIFEVKGLNKTLGEITIEEKNKLSHRGKALDKLAKYLKM